LTNLAAVYFEQGEYEKCIEACNKAVEEGRSLRADYKVIAKAMARIGSAYEKQGNLELAVKNYGKALTEHRTPETLTKLRNAEKAKADAEKQAYINPELAEQAREAGNVQFKAGQFADAVKSYTEAIKRLPTDPRGYNNRAAAYNKLAALPEALKDAEEAVKIDPSFVKAYLRQSTVLLGMKEPTKAMEACQAVSLEHLQIWHDLLLMFFYVAGHGSRQREEAHSRDRGTNDEVCQRYIPATTGRDR
jgi:stress-induced-phosphoprotein 1